MAKARSVSSERSCLMIKPPLSLSMSDVLHVQLLSAQGPMMGCKQVLQTD